MFHVFVLQMGTRGFTPMDGSNHTHFYPVMDMADHRNDCSNKYDVGTCSSALAGKHAAPAGKEEGLAESEEALAGNGQDSAKRCIVWTAGADIATGDEICLSYS